MFPVKISYLNTRTNVERIVFEFIFRVEWNNLDFFLGAIILKLTIENLQINHL